MLTIASSFCEILHRQLQSSGIFFPWKFIATPPVMLETQNDTKVLGYMCDSYPEFYCRGSLVSHEAAVKAAAQFAGVHSHRPICIGGAARLRQPHCVIPRGGTYADIAASHDCIHAKDGRWKLRSSMYLDVLVKFFGILLNYNSLALPPRGLCQLFSWYPS